ncbi:MAG: hypothetical protein A2176_00865 [Spirochaetes bacterium RBG_13_51_14]|nr:MAG: hypothetical protein A2176_00865 [Spirochaetes bacterium RBG_13_51_14]
MKEAGSYHAVLFKSVNQTMWAVSVLKKKGVPHKLIPVPRHISADCGVCIRVAAGFVDAARTELAGLEGFADIVRL